MSAPSVNVGPGAWTVAATLAGGDLGAGTIANFVDEVRTWDGVLDVAEVADVSAWRELTGLTSDCAEGETIPPCGPWACGVDRRLDDGSDRRSPDVRVRNERADPARCA